MHDSPVGQMLHELEQRFFRLSLLGGGRISIRCRFCGYEDTFDDADHGASQLASERFHRHLRARHGEQLGRAIDVRL